MKIGGLRLSNYAHTAGTRFINVHSKPNSSITVSSPVVKMLDHHPLHQGCKGRIYISGGGGVVIRLTSKRPQLVSNRQVSVLYYPFRKGELCRRDGHTARKTTKTIASLMNAVQQVTFPCVPHDFLPCQAYSIFRRRGNKPGKR